MPLSLRSRPFFVALLAAILLLVQGYLLEHELEHALAGDSDSCIVCHLAGHQGDALTSEGLDIALPLQRTFWVPSTYHYDHHTTRYYPVRAPPLQTVA